MRRGMASGQLRHRVTFQRRAPGENSGGVTLEEWDDLTPVRTPALVEPMTGERAERIFGGDLQVQGVNSVLVTVRYRSDLRLSDRLIHHGGARDRVMQIVGLQNIGENDEALQLACVAVEAAS